MRRCNYLCLDKLSEADLFLRDQCRDWNLRDEVSQEFRARLRADLEGAASTVLALIPSATFELAQDGASIRYTVKPGSTSQNVKEEVTRYLEATLKRDVTLFPDGLFT